MEKYNIIKDSAELRKCIAENPNLPICVLVGQDAHCDDYPYTYCDRVSCSVDTILSCNVPFRSDNTVYDDERDFEEDLADWMAGQPEYHDLTDSEFETALNAELEKYKPYWKKVIAIFADN